MKLGLHIATYTWDGGAEQIGRRLGEIAEAAETAGFDMLTVVDHLWQHPIMGGREQPMLEAYSTLGFTTRSRRPFRIGSTLETPDLRPMRSSASSAVSLRWARRRCSASW